MFLTFLELEYINHGKDGFLVDPDPDLIYTKRKLAKQNESAATNTTTSSVITFSTANNFSFPQQHNVTCLVINK